MRYKLDINGYIDCVLWGCYTGTCQEYTGTVPSGYETLTEWADNAIINAYYINDSGNLALDAEREADLKIKIEQQTKDYTPVLRRELYETAEVLDSQYVKETASGKFIVIDNVKNIPPVVTLSDLQEAENVTIFAHTRNMLPVGKDGISGSATIGDNTESLFALLAGEKYCLNIGNHTCEMLYYDGETTEQVYSGGSGVITLPENKKVTRIVFTGEGVIYPTLNPGSEAIEFEEGKTKSFTTVANDSMVTITEGVNLHNGYNLVYTDQGNDIFMEYSTTGLTGSVGGWKIDGNALWCDIIPPGDFTEEDHQKVQGYIVGLNTLTDEELAKYDVSGDGKVNSLDALMIHQMVAYGLQKSDPGKLVLDTTDWRTPIRMINNEGKTVASFGVGGAYPDITSRENGVLNIVHPVGSVICTATNENPGETIGGSWTLIDKEYKELLTSSSNSSTYFDNKNCESFTLKIERSGHSMNLTLEFTTAVQLSDTEVTIGNINIAALGISGNGAYQKPVMGFTDAGNCSVMMLFAGAGKVSVVDVLPDDYIAAGRYVYSSVNYQIPASRMIDSHCNKFYWRRTE